MMGPRKGGQELPDDVQDRPEQNEGYDDAVRGADNARTSQDSEGLAADAEDDEEFDEDAEDDEDEEEDEEDEASS
jgi:hypothetical protein